MITAWWTFQIPDEHVYSCYYLGCSLPTVGIWCANYHLDVMDLCMANSSTNKKELHQAILTPSS